MIKEVIAGHGCVQDGMEASQSGRKSARHGSSGPQSEAGRDVDAANGWWRSPPLTHQRQRIMGEDGREE